MKAGHTGANGDDCASAVGGGDDGEDDREAVFALIEMCELGGGRVLGREGRYLGDDEVSVI